MTTITMVFTDQRGFYSKYTLNFKNSIIITSL